MSLAWMLLLLAVGFEVAGTTCLKVSDGMSRPMPTVMVFVLYGVSFALLAQALKHGLDLSVGYAVWSGVGTASIAIIGFAAFKETITPMKLVGIGLIIAGVVVLELFSRAGHAPPGIR